MSGFSDLMASERSTFCVGIIFLASVLVMLSKLSGAEWVSVVQLTIAVLVTAKTATGYFQAKKPTTEIPSQVET